jgi:hypothetical protein
MKKYQKFRAFSFKKAKTFAEKELEELPYHRARLHSLLV